MRLMNSKKTNTINSILLLSGLMLVWSSCTNSSGSVATQQMAQQLPVFAAVNISATTHQEFSATLEGTEVIEIRPQVNGYLDQILIDEGANVKKGQTLFVIDDHIYREQLNNAQAALATAKANLANASIEVSRLTPLVQNNVVSELKLQTARATHEAAAAAVAQAEAQVASASINLGYTKIKAPVDGFIGRIPFKKGSVVGVSTDEPLTVISDVNDVYAYFSFSETDFLKFGSQFTGNTLEEKIKQIPPVDLVLADNTIYPSKGKVQIVTGQFNSTGAISLRAKFPNTNGMLRSGITGKIRIPRTVSAALAIPQESTFELQDKILVFTLNENNIVSSVPVHVADKYGNFYLVDKGVTPGQKVVYAGVDRLRDGALIQPTLISIDSLLKSGLF